ncbi:symplekin-related [Anaeramoeba flamelloides]|uniref:Symplekin-related n=1 Tax=Anaeramoeba flamelloides TaxID=1746091 RepID=A0ABQ8Y7X8_9EUKA|nr:symplekin-related [Anaeramoeba flamelloides]
MDLEFYISQLKSHDELEEQDKIPELIYLALNQIDEYDPNLESYLETLFSFKTSQNPLIIEAVIDSIEQIIKYPKCYCIASEMLDYYIKESPITFHKKLLEIQGIFYELVLPYLFTRNKATTKDFQLWRNFCSLGGRLSKHLESPSVGVRLRSINLLGSLTLEFSPKTRSTRWRTVLKSKLHQKSKTITKNQKKKEIKKEKENDNKKEVELEQETENSKEKRKKQKSIKREEDDEDDEDDDEEEGDDDIEMDLENDNKSNQNNNDDDDLGDLGSKLISLCIGHPLFTSDELLDLSKQYLTCLLNHLLNQPKEKMTVLDAISTLNVLTKIGSSREIYSKTVFHYLSIFHDRQSRGEYPNLSRTWKVIENIESTLVLSFLQILKLPSRHTITLRDKLLQELSSLGEHQKALSITSTMELLMPTTLKERNLQKQKLSNNEDYSSEQNSSTNLTNNNLFTNSKISQIPLSSIMKQHKSIFTHIEKHTSQMQSKQLAQIIINNMENLPSLNEFSKLISKLLNIGDNNNNNNNSSSSSKNSNQIQNDINPNFNNHNDLNQNQNALSEQKSDFNGGKKINTNEDYYEKMSILAFKRILRHEKFSRKFGFNELRTDLIARLITAIRQTKELIVKDYLINLLVEYISQDFKNRYQIAIRWLFEEFTLHFFHEEEHQININLIKKEENGMKGEKNDNKVKNENERRKKEGGEEDDDDDDDDDNDKRKEREKKIKIENENEKENENENENENEKEREKGVRNDKEKENKMEEKKKVIDNRYSIILEMILLSVCQKLNEPNEILTKFYLSIPEITPNAFQILFQYIETPNTTMKGFSLLIEILYKRPTYQNLCLEKILEISCCQIDELRPAAIRLLVNRLYLEKKFKKKIQNYSLNTLQKLKMISKSRRILDLFYSLTVKTPKLLLKLVDLFIKSNKNVKSKIKKTISSVITELGPENKVVLQIIQQCDEDTKELVLSILKPLTRATMEVHPKIIELVKDIYYNRINDPHFLIPILSGLDENEFTQEINNFLSLSTVSLKLAIKHLFALPRRLIEPTVFFKKLHNISFNTEEDKKKIIMAIEICVIKQKEIFNQEVLAGVIQQMIDQSSIPPLFMRTLIRFYQSYPKTGEFVASILKKLIRKRVWKDKNLWVGFKFAIIQVKKFSYGLLLSLPAKQLEEIFESNEELKKSLIKYVNEKSIKVRRSIAQLLK